MSFVISTGIIEFANFQKSAEYVIYTPRDSIPRAVVQIVHGFNETVESYEECGFVDTLTFHGFVVCGLKLRGFGEDNKVELGNLSVISDDIASFFTHLRKTYRRLPFILFGHDLGSLLVRDYMVSGYSSVDGVILSGTWNNTGKLRSEMLKTKLDILLRGKDFIGYYSDKKIFGHNCDQNGKFTYTSASYLNSIQLLERVSAPEWAGNVPLSLPVLLVSGEDDVLEKDGNGPSYVHSLLFDAELCELQLKKYEGCGHAPHYSSCRDTAFTDVCSWIDDVCQGVVDWGTLKI